MESLRICGKPRLKNARMVLAFSGWMDGGEVSTGTVGYLIDKLKARKFAEIDAEEFYVFNIPGSMEVSSLFRPHIKIENGTLKDFDFPKNEFFYVKKKDLVLFSGKEPNLKWEKYASCIFELAAKFNVEKMYFIGSVGGPTPHTREPRILSSVSSEKLKSKLKSCGFKFTNYEGPGSIATLLTTLSKEKRMEMMNFVAEIPVYVQAKNPKCIEAMLRRLVKLLDIDIDLSDLRKMADELQKRLDKAIGAQPELSKQVRKLEEIYDKEIFDTQMKDLETWFKERGVTL